MIKIAFFIAILISMIIPQTFAEDYTVPGWIKNNAGWWADGLIDDNSFVSGIQWLIANEIIYVPPTVSEKSESSVPIWVKNTAGWWHVDKISDLEFLNAIQYLVKIGIISTGSSNDYFTNSNAWSTFDFGTYGIGENPEGYRGAVFDGKYLYFVPYQNGIGRHGEVLRYDTTSNFESSNAWNTFNPGASGLGSNFNGYQGGIFDGRYVYFVPYHTGGTQGEVLRYDTTSNFESLISWSTFNASTGIGWFASGTCMIGELCQLHRVESHGVGNDPVGFEGAVFDGRYVYFVPHIREGGQHGEVLRYDTTDNFLSGNAWSAFDASANGVGNDPVGFVMGVFDGRYIYFVPYLNEKEQHHGEVLRYDTTSNFESPESWSAFDAGANGVGINPVAYEGAVFDGRYVYFVPSGTYQQHTNISHSEVLRYDTTLNFESPDSWTTFIPSLYDIGEKTDGYVGAIFDGRYIYFTPYHNGNEYHGEVLRYDTTSNFESPNSWSTFDAGANGVGNDPDGYWGVELVGKYIYFVPYHNDSDFHSEVLRYDTTSNFESPNSWSTFDVSNYGSDDPDGFEGAAFDGRYVYFTPTNNGSFFHGEVLRYDTTSNFESPESWSTFNPSANGVGNDPVGYIGAIFDGRYVYFAPHLNNSSYHGEVLRYDTTSNFESPNSWSTFDASVNGVGNNPVGFVMGVFDGRYVYFVPYYNGSLFHGEVLRYDTTSNFESPESWSAFDAGANGVGVDSDGYQGGIFDGRYIYFVPYYNGSLFHGEVLRYDTTSNFESPESWSAFDAGENGVGNDPVGYRGATFDGRYVYFVPWKDSTGSYHGEVLRYDTKFLPVM